MKELTNKEKEEIYKKAMSIVDTDDIDLIRSVSCQFYRDGGCEKVYSSECRGCLDEESVLTCRAQYLSKIFDHPMYKWSPEFDKATPAKKKVKLEELRGSVGVQCSSCYMADRCPLYKAGSECSIDWGEEKDVTDLSNKDIVNHLMNIQHERVTRMATFEKVDGGMVDLNLSGEMDRLSRLVSDRYNLDTTYIRASLESRGGSSKEGGGILAKLLGGNQQKSLPEKSETVDDLKYEDVEYDEIKKEDEDAKSTKSRRRSRGT